ncbi:MAG TPA: outer membrane beta-barrel protein [Candidatus Kapabacteria bacterium]|nr:outer membrane beta-barrel protein [Candidatus Kapabacteria bacterium]
MRKKLCYLILSFTASALFAQEHPPRFFIGPMMGYNFSYHKGITTDPANGDILSGSAGGDGNGSLLGLTSEYWLGNRGGLAIQCKLYYEQMPGAITLFPTGQYYDPYQLGTSAGINITYNTFNFEALFKYEVIAHLGIVGGPEFGYVINRTYSENGATFSYKDSVVMSLFNASGEIPGSHTWRTGIDLGLQYEFFWGNFLITPAIIYDFGITPVAQAWRVNTLAGTIDVKYGL